MEQKRKSQNRNLGHMGERLVAEYLCNMGMKILDCNWRIREGEIDIVAKEPSGVFVFVEVKTRSTSSFGHPLEAINSQKARRLQHLALAWLATHQSLGHEYRIDCAAVLFGNRGEPAIDYRRAVL